MIGIVTDSNSQLPPELADRHGIGIVPLTVTVDGTAYAEGTEITADDFFARYADGASPDVSTAAPSPGAFLQAYGRMAERGVDEILSIHIGADVSGTINAARLAAPDSPVPVRLIDTGTASFGVACCVWEAADALERGATADEVEALVARVAPSIGNVFVVGALDIVRAGGRLATGTDALEARPGLAGTAEPVSVLSLRGGQIERIGAVRGVDEACDAMVGHVLAAAGETPLRVAVGIADPGARELSDALEARIRASEAVAEVVHYRIGPSVGAHTGPGTAGCFFWPVTGG